MITVGCSCGSAHGNTGLPNCVPLLDKALGYGVQAIVGASNTLNAIPLDSAVNAAAYWATLLANQNRNIRLYPITGLRNVTRPVEDNQYATDSAGGKVETREGVRSFMAEKWDVSPAYVSKLKEGKCGRNGVYIFSKKGVQGIKQTVNGITKLYPIFIQAYAPYYLDQVDDAPSKAMIPFDYDESVNVGQLWMIPWEQLGTSYSAMLTAGIMDVNMNSLGVSTDSTNTTVELTVSTDYGQGVGVDMVDGLVAANFTVRNQDTGLAVTIISVVENPDTSYEITFVDQTAGDLITIKVVPASGYEGSLNVAAV